MENRDYTNLDYIDKVSYCFPTLIFWLTKQLIVVSNYHIVLYMKKVILKFFFFSAPFLNDRAPRSISKRESTL